MEIVYSVIRGLYFWLFTPKHDLRQWNSHLDLIALVCLGMSVFFIVLFYLLKYNRSKINSQLNWCVFLSWLIPVLFTVSYSIFSIESEIRDSADWIRISISVAVSEFVVAILLFCLSSHLAFTSPKKYFPRRFGIIKSLR